MQCKKYYAVMNYFDLYDIPVTLKVDANTIKQKFYALSRKYHPDFFGNENEEAQTEALEKSSLINKAFKTFSSTDETIKYVLQLKGLLQQEEKYNLPSDFLMEVMELNEQINDGLLEFNETKIIDLKSKISNLQIQLYEPVKQIVEHYKEGVTTEEELLQVKTYYFQKKYIDRILSSLNHH